MSTPYSFNDPPGKNVRDGLIAMLGALVLIALSAGDWLDVFFVSLWGIFLLIGFLMVLTGGIRTIRHRLLQGRKAPLASKRRGGFIESLRKSFEQQRAASALGQKPVSEILVAIWFLSCILGPLVGWLVTANIFFDVTDSSAFMALLARFALTVPIQALAGIILAVRYRAPVTVKAFFALFVLSLSALSVWSGLASARDLLQGGVVSEPATVVEYQPAGYFNAPWFAATRARELNYGRYNARLSDGRELTFYCTPVCLTYWNGRLNKESWAGGLSVRMYYLRHRRQIVRLATAEEQ